MLLSYLRRQARLLLMLLLFAGIFWAVFSLYELPAEAVGYAAALCLAVGLLFLGLGYARYARRCRALEALRQSVAVSLAGLPEPPDRLERAYRDCLAALFESRRALQARAAAERREAEDYYTLWAHQIKTPIAAMRLLLQEGDPAAGAPLLAELLRIEQYVEMALSYIRLESDATDYVLRKCALDDVVRGCLRKYAGLFISSRLSLDFRPTGRTVLTDEKWLAFVLEQLLSNALKYTRRGGVSIYARGRALVIEDTGIGIPPEDLPRVCERGFTGYNGREDKKSTGLGLYLCSRVCGKLGHRLTLESAPAQGARALVTFSDETLLME